MSHHSATETEEDTTPTWSSYIDDDNEDDDTEEVGGDTSSWPAAEELESVLTKRKIRALCNKYSISTDTYKPLLAGETRACAPLSEENGRHHHNIIVYADAIEVGMRLPLGEFYVEVLCYYGLAPSQLVPNSWRYMAIFVLLCEEARVKPSVPVFQHFFTLCSHGGRSRGWHYFKSSSPIFRGVLAGRYPRWRCKFFILRSLSVPWPCPVNWGEPREAAMCKPTLTAQAMAVVNVLLDKSAAITGQRNKSILRILSDRLFELDGASVPLPREVKPKDEEVNVNNGAEHTRKRKAPDERATPLAPPSQQARSSPPGFGSGAGECSATRSLFDLVQDAAAEVQGRELELQAAKDEVAQLKLELVAARDGLRLLKETHAEELQAVKSANAAEVAQLKEELQLAAAKLQREGRYLKLLKSMKQQISSVVPDKAKKRR